MISPLWIIIVLFIIIVIDNIHAIKILSHPLKRCDINRDIDRSKSISIITLSMSKANDNLIKNHSIHQDIIKTFLTFLSGVFVTYFILTNSSFKPIDSVDDIPMTFYKEKRVLQGDILKVIDGDTYKFYNVNLWQNIFNSKREIKKALTIRVAGIDTPEIPKKGFPGQEYGIIAKDYVSKKLIGKRVSLKLLSKDQYNRIVGVVEYMDGFNNIDMAEQLLREGLAVVYRQGGAQYDNKYDYYNKLELEAKRMKKGIWKNGVENADIPSVYKKSIKSNALQ